MRLILGSTSPRRVEILGFFSYPFEQISPQFDESSVTFQGDPASYALEIARGKADSLALQHRDAAILTADTCVSYEDQILNKPADESEAFEMLQMLSGSFHTVYTGLVARHGSEEYTDVAKTEVEFHALSKTQMERYHAAFEGRDKAGGYGIQMAGSVIIKQIKGCFYNVMGLPPASLCPLLQKVGIDLWDYLV